MMIALGATAVADVPPGNYTLSPGSRATLPSSTSCGERAVTYLADLGQLRIHVGRDIKVNGERWPRRPDLETHGVGMTAVRSDMLEGLHVQISLRFPTIGLVLVVGLDDTGHTVCTDGRYVRR